MALSGEWSIQLHGFVAELRSEKASTEVKIDAAKGLASIARSDNQNDQMSQQNAIISAGGDDALVRLLADTQHESLQWWVALALTQLVFANERAIEAMVDFSVLGGGGTIREQLALAALSAAERAQVAQDIREHEAAERAGTKPCLVATIAGVLSNGRGHTTDRVKYGCLHIATNIANKHWGAPLVDSVDSGVDSVGRRVDSVDSVDSGRRLGEWSNQKIIQFASLSKPPTGIHGIHDQCEPLE